MNIAYDVLKLKRAVFIADRVNSFSDIKLEDMTLEMTTPDTINLIISTLESLCQSVIYYASPDEFIQNISNHQNDIILSIWSGTQSRNRKALIPSICEAYNICYIGADPYVNIVCQDKKLSKEVCEPYGITGAKDILLRSEEDISQLKYLNYPLVIKPNYEGGSIGISNKNLVDNYETAKDLAQRLLPTYEALLAEEYIPGYEVCVCISGVLGYVDIFEGVQSNFGGERYIETKIYGYEYKKGDVVNKSKEHATDKISPAVKQQLLNLYWGLGKVEVMRIDGRIDKSGKFHLIELSPDCSLAPTASTATSYKYAGYTYTEMIASLLWNAIQNQEYQNAKKK